MLALGILFLPVTKLFGPIVAWNIALRTALAASACSMCLVLRRWTTWWPAAFVGGLLYGFSAYAIYLGGGYLFLTFVPLPPIVFLLLHEILVRQRWRPGRTQEHFSGFSVRCSFFIWSEILASTMVLGVIAVALFSSSVDTISSYDGVTPEPHSLTALPWAVCSSFSPSSTRWSDHKASREHRSDRSDSRIIRATCSVPSYRGRSCWVRAG